MFSVGCVGETFGTDVFGTDMCSIDVFGTDVFHAVVFCFGMNVFGVRDLPWFRYLNVFLVFACACVSGSAFC